VTAVWFGPHKPRVKQGTRIVWTADDTMRELGGRPTLDEDNPAGSANSAAVPGYSAVPRIPLEDRRQSRRFPTPDERRDAILRLGDRETPVQLLDESSTGFAVVCDQHPGVFEGETLWIKTVAGWETVSAVSVTSDPAGVRIGLRRLNDMLPTPAAEPTPSQDTWLPSNRLRLVVGLTLVLTLIAVPVVRSSLMDPLRVVTIGGRPNIGSPDGLPLPEAPLSADATVEEVLRHLGPKVFSKSEIQKLLKMSPTQVAKLRRIERECNHAVNMAMLGGSPAETTMQLKRQAYQDVLKLLTQQQREVWHELVRRLQSRQAGYLWQKEAQAEAAGDRAFD